MRFGLMSSLPKHVTICQRTFKKQYKNVTYFKPFNLLLILERQPV